MSRVLASGWLLRAGLAVVLISGCSRGARSRRVVLEQQIGAGIEKQLGVVVEQVSCPRLSIGAACDVQLATGERLIVDLDDLNRRNVQWRTRGLVIRVDELEEHLANQLGGSEVQPRVDCGGAVRAGEVGMKVECSIDFGEGRTARAVATILNDAGEASFTMQEP